MAPQTKEKSAHPVNCPRDLPPHATFPVSVFFEVRVFKLLTAALFYTPPAARRAKPARCSTEHTHCNEFVRMNKLA